MMPDGRPMLEDVAALVDPDWLATETLALCRIASVTMDEQQVCQHYAARLGDLGLHVDMREVTPGRHNLYSVIAGVGGGPTLALNGHLDTVPICGAWPPARSGDRIFGRGATDMKGGMAAILGVARALKASKMRLKGDLVLTAVVGHEEAVAAKDGPKAFVTDLNCGRVRADAILIVEGAMELWVMSMGAANFTIRLTSESGGTHTDNTPMARNPIRFMAEIIQRICSRQTELDAGERHPLAGPERIDLGIAQAGDLYNRTPPLCTLIGTRRWAPGRTVNDIRSEIESMVAPIAAAGGLGFENVIEQAREPFETAASSPIVAAARRAAAAVTGVQPATVGRRIVGDANIYVNGTGIPTLYYGPMNTSAHSDTEWVSISDIAQCARVYIATAMEYCGVA
jgi:acetylornithine deacetylase